MPNKPKPSPGDNGPMTEAAAAAAAPSSPTDLTAIQAGRKAALLVAERITQELPLTLDPLDRIELRRQRDRARTVAEDLRQIEVDLVASGSRVQRLSDQNLDDLIRLASDLDEAIVKGRLINLGLDTVGRILESAVRIKDIVQA